LVATGQQGRQKMYDFYNKSIAVLHDFDEENRTVPSLVTS